jgi:hypothetical protein
LREKRVDITAVLGALIPIVSVTLGIGMIVVSILVKHRRQMQELDHRHKERMAAIEKGLDLPPDPVSERIVAAREAGIVGTRGAGGGGAGSRYLLRGLIWLGVGLAVALTDSGIRDYGWIGVAVGVAYLIYYAVEGRREAPPSGHGGPPA